MGEKRKTRPSMNERSSKREKKSSTGVTASASNEEIDEQSSVHSGSDSTETHSQQQENVNVQEVEETPIIEVEVIVEEASAPVNPPTDETAALPLPSPVNTSRTKSWWSSIARLFHFGSSDNENKASFESNTDDLPSSPFCNGSYLSNIKSRRSLHGDTSLVG